MDRDLEQSALARRHHGRHALDGSRQELAVADDAQAARAFGDQRVAAGQEGDRPRLHEALGERDDAIVVKRGAQRRLAGNLDSKEEHAGNHKTQDVSKHVHFLGLTL